MPSRVSTRKAGLLVIGHGLVMIAWGLFGVLAGSERRSHCLLYAMQRFQDAGGAIVLTRSKRGRYLHVSWTANYREFEELNPMWKKSLWRWPWPPILFAGKVRRWTQHDGFATAWAFLVLAAIGALGLIVEWRLGWVQEFFARL